MHPMLTSIVTTVCISLKVTDVWSEVYLIGTNPIKPLFPGHLGMEALTCCVGFSGFSETPLSYQLPRMLLIIYACDATGSNPLYGMADLSARFYAIEAVASNHYSISVIQYTSMQFCTYNYYAPVARFINVLLSQTLYIRSNSSQ